MGAELVLLVLAGPKGVQVLWSEAFDGGVPGSMTQYQLADTSAPWQAYPSSNFSFSAGPLGDSSAGHPSYSSFSDSCDDWLVSPAIDLPNSGNSLYLSFYYGTFRSNITYKGVLISTGSPDPADSDYAELVDLTDSVSSDAWTQLIVDLSDYAGQTVYIAFRYKYSGFFNSQEWLLDSIVVYEELAGIVDAGVKVLSPSRGVTPGDTFTPQAQLINYGDYDLTDLPVSYEIYDLTGDSLVYADTQSVSSISPGETLVVSFEGLALDQIGPYRAAVSLDFVDDNPDNNADTSVFGVIAYYYTAHLTTSLPPNIDGVLDDPAWGDADTLDVSDFLGAADSVPDGLGSALLLAVHNYENLYIALIVKPDTSEDAYDQAVISFDDNNDDQWPQSDSTEGANAITHSQWYYAYYTQSGWSGWRQLDNPPEFATSYSDGYLVYEMTFPISPSADEGPWVISADVSQNSSDTVGMALSYLDGTTGYPAYSLWPQDLSDASEPALFANLVLEGRTATKEAQGNFELLRVLGLKNPTLLFNLPSASKAKVAVYDASGRLVRAFDLEPAKSHKLALGFLKPGVYVARASFEDKELSVKFVVR